jgi:hypothetical protein
VIATAILDLWQLCLWLVFGLPITNWAMIGRWVVGFRDGRFIDDIGKAKPVKGERALGWLVHYIVGVGYAVVYFLLMRFVFDAEPGLMSALLFGAASVSVTWFVMEPALGGGMLASNLPRRAAALAQDFTSHLSIGFGLYVGAMIARALAA